MVECRGRNGWFVLHRAEVERLDWVREGHVALNFSSKMKYFDFPPVCIRGPKREIMELLEHLLKEVRGG